ncbi:biotin--[acetyl-CoA-carboxylase] ligase [Kaistella polysaccharea]|uniref:biotin--[acetyl-CoA-carboxylase] ligase n=1 Tax=Kaistella polysaccharea TaxID=2878534 RepID=UPI001CF462FC|nr:biotin--[acetyl-CoA-carboxylase] ligase [Kaistella polysaccharea]
MTNLFYLPECSSTQDEIKQFVISENPTEIAVYTFHQTKGKGQYGNSWQLGENLNIAYSLAIPTASINLADHLLNFRTAELLAEFLANLTQDPVAIKWPNDIIIINKKVAGLLIEKKIMNKVSYFVVGIGLNVLQKDFETLSKAGSLLTQTGINHDLHSLAERLHHYLVQHFRREVSAENVLQNLNDKLYRKNEVSVFEIEEVRQNGIIEKVDQAGYLWVDLEHSGLQKFFHKEIQLLY